MLAKATFFVIGVGGLTMSGWAIARWNGDNLERNNPPMQNVDIPIGIRNTIVRVGTGWPIRGGFGESLGTGIVLDARRDGERSTGGWFCVLTSLHSTLAPPGINERLVGRTVGFGDGQGRLPLGVPRGMFFPFPQPQRGNRADLAILGVRVTDWENQVPREMTFTPIMDLILDTDLVMAGYGRDARVDVRNRRYEITLGRPQDVFGTLRSGTNRSERVLEHTTDPSDRLGGMRFTYQAIESDLDFHPARGVPMSADAHILGMDSGGPTFQFKEREWRLVGLHSESEERPDRTVPEGARQWDVHLFTYREWVQTTCNQIIPEPTTILSLLSGSMLLLFRRRKRT
jgi:hypothetical protein